MGGWVVWKGIEGRLPKSNGVGLCLGKVQCLKCKFRRKCQHSEAGGCESLIGWKLFKASQELRMLSIVTLFCHNNGHEFRFSAVWNSQAMSYLCRSLVFVCICLCVCHCVLLFGWSSPVSSTLIKYLNCLYRITLWTCFLNVFVIFLRIHIFVWSGRPRAETKFMAKNAKSENILFSFVIQNFWL